jgi:hypothetical protein
MTRLLHFQNFARQDKCNHEPAAYLGACESGASSGTASPV